MQRPSRKGVGLSETEAHDILFQRMMIWSGLTGDCKSLDGNDLDVTQATQQTPLGTPAGSITGVQSIKHIPAARVYVKSTTDSTTAAPVLLYAAYTQKSNGTTITAPTGTGVTAGTYIDLGIMSTPGKVTYTKSQKKVQTGIDKITQLIYVESRSAMIEFNLDQMDDYLLQQLGFNSSVVTAGSSINFQIGQEDVVNLAMVLVYQNKIDGKEIQWYHPSAAFTVTFETSSDSLAIKCSVELIAFQAAGASLLSLVSTTVFH